MKVTHVIRGINKEAGGTSFYIKGLIESLDGKINQNLVCFNGNEMILIDSNIELNLIEPKMGSKLYSSEMKNALLNLNPNIFHGNGLWDLPVHLMARVAQSKRIPYIISPHGMLEPWSLRQNRVKKLIALKLFQYNDLKHATCLHATATMEAENIRALGFKNPIAVIPNGIPLSEFEVKDYKNESMTRKVLFLSRIVENKGVLELIEAWSQIPKLITASWELEIIGNGEPEYIAQLNSIINKKKLNDKVIIKGPLFGVEKVKSYQNAYLFVLPTYSENFGIVVAEALACGTPVITTKGAPWQDLETYECGWWINSGVGALRECLEHTLSLSPQNLVIMGRKGRKLIEQKYSIQIVARQMRELYHWILNNEKRPDFVKIQES